MTSAGPTCRTSGRSATSCAARCSRTRPKKRASRWPSASRGSTATSTSTRSRRCPKQRRKRRWRSTNGLSTSESNSRTQGAQRFRKGRKDFSDDVPCDLCAFFASFAFGIQMTVREVYERELEARGYASDPAQLRAVDALDRCAREWGEYKEQRSNVFKKLINRPDIPRGVYMYGGVGRGKSFLMDCFYTAVPIVRKTRLHFHEFMREVHRQLSDLQGTVNPLEALGERIAKRFRLVCFG